MLIAAVAALVLFAAPETTQSGEPAAEGKPAAAAADAKPEMKRVCESVTLSGSNLPKKKCKMVPVKPASGGAPAADAAKPE